MIVPLESDCRFSPTEDVVRADGSAPAADDNVWAAFEAEALPHVDRLFRLAMWLEQNRSEAEDVVQETMLRALQAFQRFQRGTNCRAWLATILQHVRSNRRRARGRWHLVGDPDDRIAETIPFVAPVPQQLTDEDVLAALRRIPAPFHEVIVLCDVEEFTYREIADALQIPVGTVMSRLHRRRWTWRYEPRQPADSRVARREGGPFGVRHRRRDTMDQQPDS
jgi:RNA polymerase sigma-70 factor (ECF subfamily)